MDGSLAGFDVRRWHRQFATAHLQDVLRDWNNPQPGPDEVWAEMYGQVRGNVEGDPTGLEGVVAGVGPGGPVPPSANGLPTVPLDPRPDASFLDIYLSAGDVDEVNKLSCDSKNDAGCSIYRVRWDLVKEEARSVRLLVPAETNPYAGMVEPAVSPDGTRFAYLKRVYKNGIKYDGDGKLEDPTDVQLWAGEADRPSSMAKLHSSLDFGGAKPQFPNFYSNKRILTHVVKDGYGSLYETQWGDGSTYTPILGPAAGVQSDTSWKDVNSQPPRAAVASKRSRKIVTFGGAVVDGKEANTPRVSTLGGGEVEEFELGSNADGDAISECHHPAWNISGTRILCSPLKLTESRTDGDAIPIRQYTRASDGTWSQVDGDGRLFTPPSDADLAADHPAFPSSGCGTLTYKYAEWCGTDDYVVFTLFCDLGAEVAASRVMLGRISTGETWDLTEAVEEEFGLAAGDMRAVFATCAPIIPGAAA